MYVLYKIEKYLKVHKKRSETNQPNKTTSEYTVNLILDQFSKIIFTDNLVVFKGDQSYIDLCEVAC